MAQRDNPRRRILLECSYISLADQGSGIQRVVRNILNQSKKTKIPLGWDIHFVAWRRGRFYELNWPTATPAKHSSDYHDLKTKIVRALKMVLPSAIYSFLKLVWVHARPYIKKSEFGDRPLAGVGEVIDFSEKDTLILLDSSWQIPYWREVTEAKSVGAKVGMVAYDLIPTHLPQYCDAGIVTSFNSWLPKAIGLSDFCLTISKTTADAVKQYAKDRLGVQAVKAEAFKMAADLDRKKESKARESVIKLLADSNPMYISVGTIEPRKNQQFLLDVFEKLWDKGKDPKLYLIGKIGWHTEEFVNRVKSHQEFGKRLYLLTDLNDIELELAYREARALLIPSLEEGYGLPIIEALNHRKPVFASDIQVFREVGGSYCSYFSLNSTEDLLDKLDKFETTNKFPAKLPPKNLQWPTWEQATQDFLSRIIKFSK